MQLLKTCFKCPSVVYEVILKQVANKVMSLRDIVIYLPRCLLAFSFLFVMIALITHKEILKSV